ncbi:LysR family transcriptional regulator [Trinickia sp.]|uniref:LysR family transcriptional regulator n=1 Tax=Trinickia sp. TaxID=2571163 RepID=UPI003F81B5B7
MKRNGIEGFPDWGLLACWLAVVEAGSISDAAVRLDISQAAVSQRIKTLETQLGTTLLDRATRPARPTSAGLRLFEHAAVILRSADQMVESVRNVTGAKRIVIRIGCVDSFAAVFGPVLVRELSSASHQLRLWSGITPTIDSAMEARQLDMVVTTTSFAAATGIRRDPLFSEQFVVALPRGLKVPRNSTLTDLSRQLPLIRFSSRSVIGQQVDSYLLTNSDDIERTCEFDASDPMLALVAAGLGFAITTPVCLWQSRLYAPDVRVVPLSVFSRHGSKYPPISRTFYLVSRESELGTLPADVSEIVRHAFAKQISTDAARLLGIRHADLFGAHA